MDDRSICWDILPRVSRSFALAIKLLPAPLGEQTMLAYLIYRLIDTIEDSHAPLRVKRKLFDALLKSFSRQKYDAAEIEAVKAHMLSQVDCGHERELIEKLPGVAAVFYEQPPPVRRVTLRWGREMATGMYRFQRKRIRTFADQSRYSYYVAGVVGYLFNDLLYYNRIISRRLRTQLRSRARRFGLALQKVNILRDVAHDVPAKRYYWPLGVMQRYRVNYRTLLEPENRAAAMAVLREEIRDATQYLRAGMQYVMALPKEQIGVRMFCLIPLFMAIESYIACINNSDVFEKEKTVKITREQVGEIVAKSGLWGASNELLMKWYVACMGRVDAQLERKVEPQVVPAKR